MSQQKHWDFYKLDKPMRWIAPSSFRDLQHLDFSPGRPTLAFSLPEAQDHTFVLPPLSLCCFITTATGNGHGGHHCGPLTRAPGAVAGGMTPLQLRQCPPRLTSRDPGVPAGCGGLPTPPCLSGRLEGACLNTDRVRSQPGKGRWTAKAGTKHAEEEEGA